MDLLLYSRHRRGGGEPGFRRFEFSAAKDWDKISVPGQVGRRMAEGFTQKHLPARLAPRVNNLMHWGYGTFWGAAYGILAGSVRPLSAWLGPPFGAAVFLSDYVILPPSGLYQPIWKYKPTVLWADLSSHVVYGAGVGLAFRLLSL